MRKRTSVYFDRERMSFIGLDELILKNLAETYPLADIPAEVKKMALWLCSSRGKGVKGTIGFIINWLNRSCPAKRTEVHCSLVKGDSPLAKSYQQHLEVLWNKREHILEMNRIYAKEP